MGQLGPLSDSIQISNALIMLKYLERNQILHSKFCALWDHECDDLNALCLIVLSLKKRVGGGDKGGGDKGGGGGGDNEEEKNKMRTMMMMVSTF